MNNAVCFASNKVKSKSIYFLLCIIAFSLVVILYNNSGSKNFQNIEEAFRYYNKCEVILTVEGENSALALGIKDGVIVRDFFNKTNDGYSSFSGFGADNFICSAREGISYDVFYVKKADEYYIRLYSSAGELSQISDSCDSVFYSLQPHPSDVTEARVYYAFIREFSDDYYLKLNDELIFVNQDTDK